MNIWQDAVIFLWAFASTLFVGVGTSQWLNSRAREQRKHADNTVTWHRFEDGDGYISLPKYTGYVETREFQRYWSDFMKDPSAKFAFSTWRLNVVEHVGPMKPKPDKVDWLMEELAKVGHGDDDS